MRPLFRVKLNELLFSTQEIDGKLIYNFFVVAIAAFSGTKAQPVAASVTLEGIARNPSAVVKIMTLMILVLALIGFTCYPYIYFNLPSLILAKI